MDGDFSILVRVFFWRMIVLAALLFFLQSCN
jgi:hypothetical protein